MPMALETCVRDVISLHEERVLHLILMGKCMIGKIITVHSIRQDVPKTMIRADHT